MEVIKMGRPKGGKNRKYSKEEKYQIILPALNNEKGHGTISRETGISDSLLCKWIQKYSEGGIDALENTWKGKNKGNPYSALHSSKSLSIEERQRLEIMKLRIENERLKKGYMVKGVGANKEYVSLKDQNIK